MSAPIAIVTPSWRTYCNKLRDLGTNYTDKGYVNILHVDNVCGRWFKDYIVCHDANKIKHYDEILKALEIRIKK